MKLSDLELDNLKVNEPALSIYDDNIITSVVYDGIVKGKTAVSSTQLTPYQ